MLKRIRKHHDEFMKTIDSDNVKNTSLDTLKKIKIAYIPYNELLKEGFIAGIGWAFGVTVGFVIIFSILVIVLNFLGGLPLIGTLIASIVEQTQVQLLNRTPLIPR